MKPQFGFGKNSHELRSIEAPPLDLPDYVDLSSVSDFSEVTLLSPSSSQSQRKFPSRPVNPFFSGNFNRGPACVRSTAAQFGSDDSSCSPFKYQRRKYPDFPPPSRSPQFPNMPTRQTCFFDTPCSQVSSMPPLVSTAVPSPKDDSGPGASGKTPRIRFKNQRNKKLKPKPRGLSPGSKSSGSGIEMAVFDACPGSRLSEEQVERLQTELVKALDSVKDIERQPKFLKSFFDQGVFWMICANESTKLWLIRNIRRLNEVWSGQHLKVVEAKIPKRPIIYVDLTDTEKSPEVLSRLERQNPGLNTCRWVVLNRKVFKTGQRLTFSTDLDSFEFLKAKKFEASWKLKTVTFRVPSRGWKCVTKSGTQGQ